MFFAVMTLGSVNLVQGVDLGTFLEQPELEALSPGCKSDVIALAQDGDYVNALGQVDGMVRGYIGSLFPTCIAPAPNCNSPLAANQHCCSFSGQEFWKNNTEILSKITLEGNRIVGGRLQFLSQVVTLDLQNPIAFVTASLSFMQPYFSPLSCRNTQDARVIGWAMSSACVSQNAIPYADTKLCSLAF
ncbi:hypothetical protein HOP50_07g49890 [Chloropicon primus]|uniref:Pherophorin domain-containing protein n=1 Tax=Chloropicon primus TaxID=1764295 RepID=A0A5B8MP41_9CHLO|nr:hypothetical protein A3770_07p49660 [Chloropicon primus]UPR01667.1 hypothetical protein HOP50_07g49890 [Chloropicon primus]|eukprot:QDZ22448.1 hypothetical protein A3770_07p49660 [Chloropicon primus]